MQIKRLSPIKSRLSRGLTIAAAVSALTLTAPAFPADHGDGPRVANDQAADIADAYLFVDPNDPAMVVIIGTTRGFIVPGEAVNFGIFDPGLRYRFEIENTGDARPDKAFDITFSPRVSNATAQTASVVFGGVDGQGTVLAPALATNPSLAPTPPNPVVTDIGQGISFFAGPVDDPFFFDIPGFNRFVASVLAGTPDATQLERGRDSFAGYNILAIALRVPVELVQGDSNEIGMDYVTSRSTHPSDPTKGKRRVDRTGVPAVNVALTPFAIKNAYNSGSTRSDAKGIFAPAIVGTLTALGTNATNIGTLASIAVARGDFLRLDVTVANQGPGGGNNAGAGFPNGRRLQDDVIDTELNIITNGLITEGDNVDANDVPFRDVFPFVAASQQPREGAGNVDDNTRN